MKGAPGASSTKRKRGATTTATKRPVGRPRGRRKKKRMTTGRRRVASKRSTGDERQPTKRGRKKRRASPDGDSETESCLAEEALFKTVDEIRRDLSEKRKAAETRQRMHWPTASLSSKKRAAATLMAGGSSMAFFESLIAGSSSSSSSSASSSSSSSPSHGRTGTKRGSRRRGRQGGGSGSDSDEDLNEEDDDDEGEDESTGAGKELKRKKTTAHLSTTPRQKLRGTILFYGDSITFGMPHNYTGRYETPWPRLLAAKLAKRGYRVVEAGLNRYVVFVEGLLGREREREREKGEEWGVGMGG